MSKLKQAFGIMSVAGLLMVSANVYAASATAIKPDFSDATYESVSIKGANKYGKFETLVTTGSGTGYGNLYRFIEWWPDEHLHKFEVFTGGRATDQVKGIDYWLSGAEAYNVTASGPKFIGIQASINNNQ